jgi:hypothetical protein
MNVWAASSTPNGAAIKIHSGGTPVQSGPGGWGSGQSGQSGQRVRRGGWGVAGGGRIGKRVAGVWPGRLEGGWGVAGSAREWLGCGRIDRRAAGVWPDWLESGWGVAGLAGEWLGCGRIGWGAAGVWPRGLWPDGLGCGRIGWRVAGVWPGRLESGGGGLEWGADRKAWVRGTGGNGNKNLVRAGTLRPRPDQVRPPSEPAQAPPGLADRRVRVHQDGEVRRSHRQPSSIALYLSRLLQAR